MDREGQAGEVMKSGAAPLGSIYRRLLVVTTSTQSDRIANIEDGQMRRRMHLIK